MGDWAREVRHLDIAYPFVQCWETAVDGGANLGDWTQELATKFKRVVAFEPAADMFARLENRFSACARVNLRPQALWEDERIVAVNDHPDRPGRHRGRFVMPDSQGVVESIALDDLELEEVGLIKLDLEGAECFAVRGALGTISRCKSVVIIEIDKLPEKRYGLPNLAAEKLLKLLGMRLIGSRGKDHVYAF